MVAATKPLDTVEYPETDHMGEHEIHLFITLQVLPLIARLFRMRRRVSRVSGNQFIYWAEGDPTKYRAPDLYVLDGISQDAPDRAVWKTWEGHVPAFALEVASTNWKKDYEEIPADYDAMGVKELVVFDPWATARSRKRVRWQLFRRTRRRGLAPVAVDPGDRIESRELGCFLRAVEDKGRVRLRVGLGANGDALMPTDEEAAAAMEVVLRITEAQAEAERLARQSAEQYALDAREAKQAAEKSAAEERERADRAEQQLAALREELEQLRRGG